MKKRKNIAPQKFFKQAIHLIQQAQQSIVRNVNITMVYSYYGLGKMIVEQMQKGSSRASYGKQLLTELSEQLSKEFGKGYSVDNLENMRRFYTAYQISETVSRKSLSHRNSETLSRKSSNLLLVSGKTILPDFRLSWSHYQVLIRIEDENEKNFYEIESIQNNWSVRELERQYNSSLYERLALSRNKKKVKELSRKGQVIMSPQDVIKDPLILEFLGLKDHESYSESDLEAAIVSKLEHFLLEFGKGFMFVARQKRITIDGKHFHIDLVLYNRLLRCFVIIDLKIGELQHQDIGQMMMYVNYFDREEKNRDENKTIGLILCKNKSDTLVKYTLPDNNKQIFASKYRTILPSKAQLKKLMR